MFYFIISTFISSLSDVLCVFFVKNQYINTLKPIDVFLHVNLINIVLYFYNSHIKLILI